MYRLLWDGNFFMSCAHVTSSRLIVEPGHCQQDRGCQYDRRFGQSSSALVRSPQAVSRTVLLRTRTQLRSPKINHDHSVGAIFFSSFPRADRLLPTFPRRPILSGFLEPLSLELLSSAPKDGHRRILAKSSRTVARKLTISNFFH